MANGMKNFAFEDETSRYTFEVVDAFAREALENLPIKIIESSKTDPVILRNIESGLYVLKGTFKTYEGASGSISFSNSMMTNISNSSSQTALQIFYPSTNYVRHMVITDDSFTQKYVYFDQLQPKPKKKEITLLASGWTGSGSIFSQTVSVSGVTENSMVDLQPSPEQLQALLTAEISLVSANESGTVTVFAVGAAPTSDYTMQVIVTEVDAS